MPLGKTSRERLATCHPDLQALIEAVANHVDAGALAYAGVHDITVACGYRGKLEQDAAFARGASKVRWPRSKHNRSLADAVDVLPYPEKWSDARKLEALHAFICGVAAARGLDLYSISWDMPHIQRDVP